MKNLLMASCLLLLTPLLARAQSATATVDFPCKLTDYRIAQPNTIVIRCDGTNITTLMADSALYRLKDESVVYPADQSRKGAGSGPDRDNPFWLKFSFAGNLESNQDYELRFSGNYKTRRPGVDTEVTENFSSTRFRFTTRPDLAVVPAFPRQVQKLSSHYGIHLSSGAKLTDRSNNKVYELSPASNDPNDFDALGQILLTSEPSSLGKQLVVEGVTDVFGRTLK